MTVFAVTFFAVTFFCLVTFAVIFFLARLLLPAFFVFRVAFLPIFFFAIFSSLYITAILTALDTFRDLWRRLRAILRSRSGWCCREYGGFRRFAFVDAADAAHQAAHGQMAVRVGKENFPFLRVPR